MENKTILKKTPKHKDPGSTQATVKEAVQKRIITLDHSSIIPGIDMNEIIHSLDLLKYALDYSEAIVDTVRVPLVVLNKKLQVLTANRSFYETFKMTPQETENKLVYKLNNNAWNIPKLRLLLEKILPNNTHFENYEVEIKLPHLGHKVMLLNARRTYRQVNHTEAILLAFEDITNRKQLEKQKDDFIGIVSHELKNPLTSIKAFSQLMEKHLQEHQDNKGSELLIKMSNQIERITQLMASFSSVYKIQNGKLNLHKEEFEIHSLVHSVINNCQVTTTSHRIDFKCDQKHAKILVLADREKITQVLINLITNAIKYSPHAERVLVSSLVEEGNIIVSIQDYGFGISKDDEDKIFERFYRVKEKTENNISGLGLGLYISKEIISQHKGKIWVKSIPNKGSTFSFTLPVK